MVRSDDGIKGEKKRRRGERNETTLARTIYTTKGVAVKRLFLQQDVLPYRDVVGRYRLRAKRHSSSSAHPAFPGLAQEPLLAARAELLRETNPKLEACYVLFISFSLYKLHVNLLGPA